MMARSILLLALLVLPRVAQGEDYITSETAARVSSRLQEAYGGEDRLAKRKAGREHDRVTIVVNRQSVARIEGTSELSKESSLQSAVTQWFTLRFEDGELVAVPRTGDQLPNANVAFEREHEGEGEVERTKVVQNEISGEVIEVLPNGQLVIAARTEMKIAEESEIVELMGRVDPRDMTSDSVVLAERIIDLTYRVIGSGAVTDATKRGWFAKLVDRFNPF